MKSYRKIPVALMVILFATHLHADYANEVTLTDLKEAVHKLILLNKQKKVVHKLIKVPYNQGEKDRYDVRIDQFVEKNAKFLR